jgi:mRNA turnover protein 4
MPKSRRAKVVPLSKTKAKTRDDKDAVVEKIRSAIDTFAHVYTFVIRNPRTNILQQIRDERRDDSKVFIGNNKLMMLALGKDEETSAKPNMFKLSKFLSGLCGLLFTNMPKKEVKEYFGSVGAQVFARTGQTAAESLTLPAGPLPQFPHSMFEHLTKLGLPIRLDKGVIMLLQDTTVCEQGDTLSAEAAQLLKLFGMQTAEFGIELTAHWAAGVARKIAGGTAKKDAAENEAA